MFSAGVFSFVSSLLMLTGPLFMMQVYDRVLTSRSVPTLVALTILMVGAFVFLAIFELIRGRIMSRIGARIDEELRDPAFNAVVEHELRKTPNIGTVPVRDLEAIRGFFSSPGPIAIFDLPWVPLYMAICFMFHPLIGWVALIGAIILFVLAIVNELSTSGLINDAQTHIMKNAQLTEEARRASEVLRAMGMQPNYRRRWRKEFDKAQNFNEKAGDRAGLIAAIIKAFRMILQSLVLAVGAWLAIKQEISPGAMIAASILMARAVAPVEQAISSWRTFLMARKAHTRLTQILATVPPEVEAEPLPDPKGRIQVSGLTLVAPGTDKIVVGNVTFNLEPGDGLGVIGPTGGGKSTLVRALVGLSAPARGAVRLDGATLEQYPSNQLGRAVGYLPQDVELFSGSIQENITRFEPEPDIDAMYLAAKRANVHEMILKLPGGYQAEMGESGMALSAGQRQRIALARALYRDPVLIVLDEPNSNLDTEGEAALIVALEGARKRGATVIVVAHRPSALKAIDKLIFLKDGAQVAFGPAKEVMDKIGQMMRGGPGGPQGPGGPPGRGPMPGQPGGGMGNRPVQWPGLPPGMATTLAGPLPAAPDASPATAAAASLIVEPPDAEPQNGQNLNEAQPKAWPLNVTAIKDKV